MGKFVASQDDMLDIRDQLDKLGAIYVLIIGRPGEDVTHCWMDMKGCMSEEDRCTLHEVVDSVFDMELEEEE